MVEAEEGSVAFFAAQRRIADVGAEFFHSEDGAVDEVVAQGEVTEFLLLFAETGVHQGDLVGEVPVAPLQQERLGRFHAQFPGKHDIIQDEKRQSGEQDRARAVER